MENEWWRRASFYQIYPRSFFDSNNDGEGDIRGVVRHIPYLTDLSIDAVWLSPFYPSPLHDGGYDVKNSRDVDSRFGTLEDFDHLVDALHSAGIKLIIDVVPNHVSREHLWFQSILEGRSTPEEEARFHIRAGVDGGPPNNWTSVFGGNAWTQLPDGRWYLHLFDQSQPDLNWTNADVVADGLETLKFWLDRGVDGFRVDVAFGLVKDMTYSSHPDPQGLINAMRLDLFDSDRDPSLPDPREILLGGPFFDRDEVHDIYRTWRKLFDSYEPDRMAVAEAWAYPVSRAMDYARSDELHQVFNFDFMMVKYESRAIRKTIDEVLASVALVDAPATWVLSNHDSNRIVTRLGEKGERKARVLAAIAHGLPGGIYIYQGEELGLPDADIPAESRQDPIFFRTQGEELGRDGCRVPLPWNSQSENCGFSGASELWLPQPSSWGMYSIDIQLSDDDSHLRFYQQMLKLRRWVNRQCDQPGVVWLSPCVEENPTVVAFERPKTLFVAANPSDGAVELEIPQEWEMAEISLKVGDVQKQGRTLKLSPHSALWLILQSM